MRRHTSWFFERKNDNFKHWVWAEEIFIEKELDLIIKLGLDANNGVALQGIVDDDRSESTVRDSEINFLYSDIVETSWIFERLEPLIMQINQEYWKFSLERIETLQFSVYKENQHYSKHMDIIFGNDNHRKISFSLQLNDPESYSGGDLVFYHSGSPETMERKQGRIIFFPSFVVHEITPVTSGTRYSLVGWVTGPHFI